jgi:hypothetical protein
MAKDRLLFTRHEFDFVALIIYTIKGEYEAFVNS